MKTNDLSCVIRIDSDHGSALLTGDIEARSEARLLQDGADVRDVTVLVVPHHGSRTSSSPAFVAAASPRYAVFTPGYRNRFGHPRPDVVARYAAAGARVHRTDHDGAVTFTFAPGVSASPKLERLAHRRYWREAPSRGEAPDPARDDAR
jgi:competence protein ComEC